MRLQIQIYFHNIIYEDKPENAEVGLDMGLRSILVEHGHNMNHVNEQIPVVKNWREIYDIITGE